MTVYGSVSCRPDQYHQSRARLWRLSLNPVIEEDVDRVSELSLVRSLSFIPKVSFSGAAIQS